jgi:hypothetical protein
MKTQIKEQIKREKAAIQEMRNSKAQKDQDYEKRILASKEKITSLMRQLNNLSA